MKLNRNRASMIATLSFFIEKNRYIVLLAQQYTNLLPPDGVHPQISSFLRVLVLCLIYPDLFVKHYCLCICPENSLLSLTRLTNATPAFSTFLFLFVPIPYSGVSSVQNLKTEVVSQNSRLDYFQ